MENNIQNFGIIEDGSVHALEEENIFLKEKIRKLEEIVVALSKKLDDELLFKEKKQRELMLKKYNINQISKANIYIKDCDKNEILLPQIYERNSNLINLIYENNLFSLFSFLYIIKK